MLETKISSNPSKEEVITVGQAAELLLFSESYILQLLEENKIPYKVVNGEKQMLLSDVKTYKKEFKAYQQQLLTEMMQEDEANNMYE